MPSPVTQYHEDPTVNEMLGTLIRENQDLQERLDELEAKHIQYRTGYIAKFTAMMDHLRVYDRVKAWQKAYDTLEAELEVTYDIIQDMPCDLDDMYPGAAALQEAADAAIKHARELESRSKRHG